MFIPQGCTHVLNKQDTEESICQLICILRIQLCAKCLILLSRVANSTFQLSGVAVSRDKTRILNSYSHWVGGVGDHLHLSRKTKD